MSEAALTTTNTAESPRIVTTINSLPSELLIRIFSLLIRNQTCIIPQNYPRHCIEVGKGHIPYPDSLLYVCSSWRRLVIGLPDFWSHIDIILNHRLSSHLVARAKVFAARAGATPLAIHVCDPNASAGWDREGCQPGHLHHDTSARYQHDSNIAHEFEFFNPLSPRIKSLDFNLVSELQPYHTSVLGYVLARCTPGVFAQCSLTYANRADPMRLIETLDNTQNFGSILLSIPSQRLEQLWRYTTSLRLDGLCPPWSSMAYHGLIELRLGSMGSRIPESSLVHILRSSPQLRFLHLRISLDDSPPLDNPVEPVRLEELEELDIMSEDSPGYSDKILRWIVLGARPLRFNFVGIPSEVAVPFCARSKITQFYGEDFVSGWETVANMIYGSSWLEVLALNARRFEDGNKLVSILCSSSPPCGGSNAIFSPTKVNTLYLLNFAQLHFEDIQTMIKKFSVGRLVLRNTSITYRVGEGQAICVNPAEIGAKLSTLEGEKSVNTKYLTERHSLDLDRW